MERPVKLKALLKGLDVTVKGSKETSVTGISSDSRTLAPGNLFIAKRGASHDGTQFIDQAKRAGAAVVVTDIYDPFLQVVQLIHPKPETIEAKLAARYYENPSEELAVVGITGTKGKTTTSYLVKHFLDLGNKPCGLIGTVETIVGDHRHFSTLTTHDAISNQKLLKEMLLKKCEAAVLEVSSHGLVQKRVDEIHFDLAVFTNLYPDHLDYHKTMEEYAAAKKQLFLKAEKSIFNADSPWSSFMGEGFTYGIEKGDLCPERIEYASTGTTIYLNGFEFRSPLIGKFNVYNLLAAVSVGLEMGLKMEQMRDALPSFIGAPGRMERIGNVFIDFAHTGEALENVLQTLKEIAQGKVIVVFGCGGNRDPQRRTAMAKAAEKWADVSIITSDNPRNEDPEEITRQILSGFKTFPLVELDRKKAIERAIAMADKDDLVLIAGKGHEKVQIFASQTISFDDLLVAREALLKYQK